MSNDATLDKSPKLDTLNLSKGSDGRFDDIYYARDFRSELKAKIKNENKENVDAMILSEIINYYPKSIEEYGYTNRRVQKVKEFMRDYVNNGTCYFNNL